MLNHLIRRLLPVALAMVAAACSQPPYRTVAGNTWGTVYHITYQSEADLSDSIRAQMRRVDMSLSPFEPASIVSRVNRNEPAQADQLLRQVFGLSQHVCSISGGAFDPTVAPLINLWGFGYQDGARDVPTQQQIDSALAYVGILQCAIDPDGTVRKKHPGTQFNFSAVAKGYGVDLIAQMLQRNGCDNYMIEIGGEVALSGMNPRGEDWHIQIDAPIEGELPGHERLMIVPLTDNCMATSGNYRNYRDTSEGRVSHTIDSRTGRPSANTTLSATVIVPDCALADALATAAMALRPEQAAAMLQSVPQARAMLVSAAPDSTYAVRYIGEW